MLLIFNRILLFLYYLHYLHNFLLQNTFNNSLTHLVSPWLFECEWHHHVYFLLISVKVHVFVSFVLLYLHTHSHTLSYSLVMFLLVFCFSHLKAFLVSVCLKAFKINNLLFVSQWWCPRTPWFLVCMLSSSLSFLIFIWVLCIISLNKFTYLWSIFGVCVFLLLRCVFFVYFHPNDGHIFVRHLEISISWENKHIKSS